MIKNLFKSINKLSLTQQLISLLLLAGAFFATFIFGYLEQNIDTFVDNQLFNSVHDYQHNIIINYQQSNEKSFNVYANDNEINHIVCLIKEKGILYESNSTIIPESTKKGIVDYVVTNKQEDGDYVYHENDERTLYSVKKLYDNSCLISIVSNDYRLSIREQLSSSIIGSLFFAFAVLMLVLLLWVFYIIVSLRQLTNFVKKIRKSDEEAYLEIDRSDEIGELGREVLYLNEEIKRQNKAKEEMIHNISHDLKTPIATIKSYAESIKDGIYPYDSLEKSVDVIIEHSERLEKKVQNLLLLNRVGYIVTSSETGNTDLEKVIDAVILSAKVIRPEIEIVKITEPSVFFGDEEPWRVVVENILDNALRYAESQITIYLDQNELSIENDGPKFDDDRLKKLFKPYEKGTGGQFGLGLSIVYRVVKAYECDIAAYNTDDGVIFKITRQPDDKKKKNNKKKGKTQ